MDTRISRLQFIYMMIWSILGVGMINLPSSIAHFTVRDAWMVPFFFVISSSIVAGICAVWVRFFPGQSLAEGLESSLGTWIGRAAELWFIVSLFLATSMFFRQLILFITTTTLAKTPYYIITGIAMFVACYGVYQGIESIARLGEFLTPLAAIIGLIVLVLSLPNADISQMQPVLADGWTSILRGAVLPSTTFSFELMFSLQFIPVLGNAKTIGRDLMIVAMILGALGMLIEATIVSVLGPSVMYMSLPLMEVARGVQIGQFVERLDTFFVMGAISTIILEISVLLYGLSIGIQRLFSLPTHKNITWAAGATIWGISILIFRNESELREFLLYVSPAYFTVSLLSVPLLAILVKTIRTHLSIFHKKKEL